MTVNDEPTLVELIGPDAYIEAHAEAMDAILPGLGGLLRELYRTTMHAMFGTVMPMAIAAASGATDELEYYGGEK